MYVLNYKYSLSSEGLSTNYESDKSRIIAEEFPNAKYINTLFNCMFEKNINFVVQIL